MCKKMQLGMKSVVRALNLIWSIRGILVEKGTFKLRTEKVGEEMEVNFMIRDNNSTSQHNTKHLHDMLRSRW